MQRILFAVFLCLLSLASAPVQAAKSELTFSWPSNAGPLNPHLYAPNQMYAQAMLYEPLVHYGEDGSPVPWLAKAWEISPDGKTYTFFLREGVVFSDGTPFNAKAVQMNVDAVLKNADRHRWLEMINQIESVEVVDEMTVRLHLKNPYYPLLKELALIRPLRFLSPTAFPAHGDTSKGILAPIGTGPWVHAGYKKGEYDVFVRNERYWGPKPALEKITVKVLPDPESRVIALKTGLIDLIYGTGGHGGQLSLEAFSRLQREGRFATGISGPLSTRVLAINSARGPTSELAVRQAIQHAVNKDLFVQAIFLGVEKRADFLFAPSKPYCDLGLKPFAFDREKAKRLLDEAGWVLKPGKNVRVKEAQELVVDFCFTGRDALEKAIAEALQGELAKIGLRLNLIGEEIDSVLRRQKDGDFGMIFSNTWGAPYEPHSMVSSMRVPAHADYQAQAGLPMRAELHEKISRVLLSTDEDLRSALYREILTTLHEQAVYLPLTYMTMVRAHDPKLRGVEFTPMRQAIPFERMSWGN
jgi:nickel transport system substrate-binding protein